MDTSTSSRLSGILLFQSSDRFDISLFTFVKIDSYISRKTTLNPKDVDIYISEISEMGFPGFAVLVIPMDTFNQFLIDDDIPTLIHTGPMGIYPKIEETLKEKSNFARQELSLPMDSDEFVT